MEGAPTLATTPLELFENRFDVGTPAIHKYWSPVICGTIGVLSIFYANWATKRPIFSGIQKHVFAGAVGAYIGKVVDEWRADYLAEKDAVLRHYIQLHPEDFPPFERKKYSEVIDPWVPIR